MKLQALTKQLEETKHYKTFKEKNPDAFFSAAFLILNLQNKTDQTQLDYYIKKENKIAAFELAPNTKEHTEQYTWTTPKIHEDIISIKADKTTPKKPNPMQPQTTKISIDIDDLEQKSLQLIKENNSNLKPTKIIAILKDDIWNLTLMDNMLGIIRIKINAISEKLLDFNKASLMEFARIKG